MPRGEEVHVREKERTFLCLLKSRSLALIACVQAELRSLELDKIILAD